jgi:hypothetical protein
VNDALDSPLADRIHRAALGVVRAAALGDFDVDAWEAALEGLVDGVRLGQVDAQRGSRARGAAESLIQALAFAQARLVEIESGLYALAESSPKDERLEAIPFVVVAQARIRRALFALHDPHDHARGARS